MIGLMRTMAFTGGDWVIYILIACSVWTVAVIVERAIVFSKEQKEIPKVKAIFEKGLEGGDLAQVGGALKGNPSLPAKVLAAGLSKMSQGLYTVEEVLESAANQEKRRLEIRMIVLNTLGSNAVYIGLFGTVLGVIKAFRDLSLAGGGGAEVVMQGLSEALIATAAGLLVAIPCVVAYNLFQKQIKEILSESDAMSRLLLAKLKTEKK